MLLSIACVVLPQALRVSRYTTRSMRASYEVTAPGIAIIGVHPSVCYARCTHMAYH